MIFQNTAVSLRNKLKAIELNESQLILQLHNDTLAYSWQALQCAPQLHKTPFSHVIDIQLNADDISYKHRFAAHSDCQTQLDNYWCNANKADLVNTIFKIEALLKQSFLSHRKWLAIKDKVKALAVNWLARDLKCQLTRDIQKALASLKELVSWTETDISEFKNSYIHYKMQEHKSFFDRLEQHPLTEAQQRACIIQDDRQLLLAGAGTGKTSVITAKFKYLLHTKQAKAADLLVLAYGSDASEELQARLEEKDQVMTFHSLGKQIIADVEGSVPKVSELSTNLQAKTAFILDTLQALSSDDSFKQLLVSFLRNNFAYKFDGELNTFLNSSVKNKFVQTIFMLISLYKQAHALGKILELETRFSDDLTLLRHFLAEYNLYLSNENSIDFDDMIIRARQYTQSGQYTPKWKFILVDEFQDISPIRAELVKDLLANKSGSQLFAVGDDWQSIYRFNGGDIRYTTEFAKHFGHATTTQLDKTFRYSQSLLDLSAEFVCANPQQITKSIQAFSSSSLPAVKEVIHTDQMQGMSEALGYIANQAPTNASVLILARSHAALLDKSTLQAIESHYQQLSIKQMTFHAAKGKEADYAVLIGLDNKSLPSRVKSAPLVKALLPQVERFKDAEERRLFYVALTRAKKQLVLVVPEQSPSEFVAELNY